jgi:hypothetical protein
MSKRTKKIIHYIWVVVSIAVVLSMVATIALPGGTF